MQQKILIVDDNPDDREITKIILAERGYKGEVEAVGRCEAALDLLRQGCNLPSLILLDLKTYGMGGINALRQIRADRRFDHIPVIIVTASSLDADKQEAHNAGADYFLRKAFDIDKFSEDVDALLKRFLPLGGER
jgi:CheY-like chemotaxis protein